MDWPTDWAIRGSISDGGKEIFLVSKTCKRAPGPIQLHFSSGGLKWPGGEADHSPPSTAENENKRSKASAPGLWRAQGRLYLYLTVNTLSPLQRPTWSCFLNVWAKFRFLGAVAKLQEMTVSFAMFVCPSVHPSAWNNSLSTERTFIKFDIGLFFKYLSRKFNVH